MKILIYANISDVSGAGGVQTYLAALLRAFGQLTDSDDEYIILGPVAERAGWLPPLAANQRLVGYDPGGQPFVPRALSVFGRVARGLGRRAMLSPRYRRPVLNLLRGSAATSGVWESNGWFESLGADLIHFPVQHFVGTRLPSVFNPHDLQHLHLPHLFAPDVFADRELKYYYACRCATRVAVASPWVAQDIAAQYGIAREKISVVPWGAATAHSPAPTDAQVAAARDRYMQDEPFLFYPAVAWPHKNHTRLLDAIAALRDRGEPHRLLLSGGGPGYQATLREAVRQRRLEPLVTLGGYLPEHDLRALYRAARAVIVPTLFEAASGPVAEAWLEGTPAACSDIPQLRLQAEGAALLFDPHSTDSLAEAIRRITRDEALRAQLSAAGRARIAANDWPTAARRYRDLYRETIAVHRRA